MNVFIVDDERLARNELKRLLSSFPELLIVGEASQPDDAVKQVDELLPDILFLDIQMPGKNGFELLENLHHIPIVIFTTAFDEFALKAFDVNALDYLLKPIEPRRLASAVNKVKELQERTVQLQEKHLLGEDSQVFVKEGEKCWFVKVSQIRLMESEGNYTRLYFDINKPLILRSLNYLEERLDPTLFFRVNRQHIINLRWIETVEEGFNGSLSVKLAGNLEVIMSRRQSQKFKELKSM